MQNEKLFEDTETETDSASVNEGAEDMQAVAEEKPKPEAKPTKKQQFIQIVKFTLFSAKAANNVPVAMTLVVIYNCLIVVPLAFGGDALVKLWGDSWGILVTALSLIINFITEFFWDKFIVFNPKVTDKILKLFGRKK